MKLILEMFIFFVIVYFSNFIFQYHHWKLFKLLNTALIWAFKEGHIKFVKLLLGRKGIDFNAKTINFLSLMFILII